MSNGRLLEVLGLTLNLAKETDLALINMAALRGVLWLLHTGGTARTYSQMPS